MRACDAAAPCLLQGGPSASALLMPLFQNKSLSQYTSSHAHCPSKLVPLCVIAASSSSPAARLTPQAVHLSQQGGHHARRAAAAAGSLAAAGAAVA